jgi:GNAT superfamily N-acetyltransferase
MREILHDTSEAALADAVEASLCKAFASFGRWPQTEVHDGAEALRCITGLPHPLFNGVFRPRLAADNPGAQIEAALAPFKARGVPLYWWVGPGAQPADLGRHLEAYGLPYDGDVPGMAVDLAAVRVERPAPAGLAIERVDSAEALAEFAGVAAIGFRLSDAVRDGLREALASLGLGDNAPSRHYLGRLDGAPVAITSLMPAAGVAGIYNVATVPEARGRGVATALVAAALAEGQAMGYRIGVLQSSEMGMSVYSRLGFWQVCTFHHYVWPAPVA